MEMEEKLVICTLYSLLPAEKASQVVMDEKASQFAENLATKAQKELKIKYVSTKLFGDVEAINPTEIIQSLICEADILVLVVPGYQGEILDYIYPFLLVFLTTHTLWRHKIYTVYLGELIGSKIFDISILANEGVTFPASSTANWNAEDECWTRLFHLIHAEDSGANTKERQGSRWCFGFAGVCVAAAAIGLYIIMKRRHPLSLA